MIELAVQAEKFPLSKPSLKITSVTAEVGVGVFVFDAVGVLVGVEVDPLVEVGVGVFVPTGVFVRVGVTVGVDVTVGVAVLVGVLVGVVFGVAVGIVPCAM